MDISRRKVLLTAGVGGTVISAGCISQDVGEESFSVEPGGFTEASVSSNQLEQESFIQFNQEKELTSESWGTSKELTYNNYWATYSNDTMRVSVGTYPVYKVGGDDAISGVIDISETPSVRRLGGVANSTTLNQVNTETIQHPQFGETIVFTYEAIYQYESENQERKAFYIHTTECTVEYVRLLLFASTPSEDVTSDVFTVFSSSVHPSPLLQEQEPTQGSTSTGHTLTPMRE